MRTSVGTYLPLLLATAAVLCSCDMAESRRVKHRGHDACIEISANATRVVVVPAWAGRLSVVDFGWGNVLHAAAKIDGKTLPPQSGWMYWDGNATDVVRHDRKHQWKGLWLHPWTDVRAEGGRVEVASADRTEAGVSARKVYELAPDGSSLTYTFTITQGEGEGEGEGEGTGTGDGQAWTLWERALVPEGGYAVAPVAKTPALPNGWIVRDGGAVDPLDRAASTDGFLVMRAGTKKGAGLAARIRPGGAAGTRGWVAAVVGSHALLILWDIAPDGDYPHYDGSHAIFWVAPEVVELEPLSAQVMLRPGKTLSLVQVWRGVTIPASVDANDPAATAAWIQAQVKRNGW